MRRKRKNDPAEAMMAIFDEMLEEARQALFDDENLAIALVGGVASFIAGVALGAPAFAVMGSATLLAYLGKSFLDFAYDSPAERALRRQKVTLREIDARLNQLEVELKRLYEEFRYYRGQKPLYTIQEFEERRKQLYEVFDTARNIQSVLSGDKFGKTAWDTIVPEIQNLVRIAVILYQRRLFLLGQLIGMGVGGDQEFQRLQGEVERLEQELRQRNMSEGLRRRREDALHAAQSRLQAYKEGLGNPQVLLGKIDEVEADLDTIRNTLGFWLVRLRAQEARITPGMPDDEIEQLSTDLRSTVQQLKFTEEAQTEMAEAFQDEVRTGLNYMRDFQNRDKA